MPVTQSLVSKTRREVPSPARLTDRPILLPTRKVNIVRLPQHPSWGAVPSTPSSRGGAGSRGAEPGKEEASGWSWVSFSALGRASPGGGSCGMALPAPCWRGGEMGSSGARRSRRELVKTAVLWFGESPSPQDGLSETPLRALASRAFMSRRRICGHHPLLTTAYLNNLLPANKKF